LATILASISAGGLVGVSNQYAYLLLLCLAGRFGLVQLSPEMDFMTTDIFMGAVGALWLISNAPSYLPLIAPGLANAANTISNLMHGFVVPVSSALIALASSGFVTLDSGTHNALLAVQLFDPTTGAIRPEGMAVAGGAALFATVLTGSKFLAKPGIAASTGTAGHASAPMFATAENIAAVVVAGLVYGLSQVDPWLLVGLGVVVAVIMIVAMIISLTALYRLGKGIGRVFRLVENQPRVGWALVAEALVWGSGSMIWNQGSHAALRFVLWIGWIGALAVGTLLWALPIIGAALWCMMLFAGFGMGVMWARGLLKRLDEAGLVLPITVTPRVPQAAAVS
jgi:hypothetical protein